MRNDIQTKKQTWRAKVNKDKLIKILSDHKLWVNMDDHGVLADLRDADLEGVDLRYANLRGAILTGTCFEEANLKGATIIGANLKGANLKSANLLYANLNNASLRSASLIDAWLNMANLTNADLTCADLRNANFCNATLICTNLDDANLTGAKYNKETAFSDGFKPKERGMIEEIEEEAEIKLTFSIAQILEEIRREVEDISKRKTSLENTIKEIQKYIG